MLPFIVWRIEPVFLKVLNTNLFFSWVMFYFLYSINFISENLLPILNIVIATTCSVAHFFPVISRHSISVDYCFKTYSPPKLNGFKQWAFFWLIILGGQHLGLSSARQFICWAFLSFACVSLVLDGLRQPQLGCRGSLPCGLSSSRRLTGFFYMVVSGQHPKRVRVEASKLSSGL